MSLSHQLFHMNPPFSLRSPYSCPYTCYNDNQMPRHKRIHQLHSCGECFLTVHRPLDGSLASLIIFYKSWHHFGSRPKSKKAQSMKASYTITKVKTKYSNLKPTPLGWDVRRIFTLNRWSWLCLFSLSPKRQPGVLKPAFMAKVQTAHADIFPLKF